MVFIDCLITGILVMDFVLMTVFIVVWVQCNRSEFSFKTARARNALLLKIGFK